MFENIIIEKRHKEVLNIIAAIFLLSCCLFLPNSFAAPEQRSNRLWNLNNVDIQSVIEQVSRETGRNFLVDPRVNGKVNMVSSHPMGSDEVYQVFLSMLQVLGYGAIVSGDVTKIIPLSEAKMGSTPVAGPTQQLQGEQLIVQVLPVKNIPAIKLVPILRPLVPDTGSIAAYAPSNTLIISGNADSLNRIVDIVRKVDRADTNNVEVISLHQATAAKVVSVLNNLNSGQNESSGKITLAADDHTNSILIGGDRQARLRTRILISQLDTPTPSGSIGNTQVVYLQYLKAKDLAPILDKMIQTSSNNKEKKSTVTTVSIQAEPTTNSIIVTAPPSTMASIKQVIQNLDRRPRQVLVEAAIVEVSDTMRSQLGILWGELNSEGTGNDENDTSISGNHLPTGFNPGIGVIKSGNLREVIYALAKDRSADILSTPSIMVMDNQQAKIEVGKTLSIETGSYASTSGDTSSVNPFTTFQRDNIGLHLYVTPQINRGSTVQLTIDQGNETLEDPVDPTTTPVTNNTTLQTVVLVNNKDILVLGGLISNQMSETQTKIPFIGDIPLVGYFFRYKSRRFEKKNLMIFLKPTIIGGALGAEEATEKKYSFIRNEQLRWENRAKHELPDSSTRVIPMWQQDQQPHLPHPFPALVTIPQPQHPDNAQVRNLYGSSSAK